MYKKQLSFQKIACLLAVIAAAVSFIYSLGVITEIHDGLKEAYDLFEVPGADLYYHMQDFNKQYVVYSIGLILAACLLFVTNTNIRRRYYIGNYVAIGIYSVATIYVNAWAHLQISGFKNLFLTGVDTEQLQFFADLFKKPIIDSTLMLDLHLAVAAVAIISVIAVLGNMVWKIAMMRGEAKLIKAGEEAAV